MEVCGKRTSCSDTAYPRLVLALMPSGAKGLMLAVMVASLVSSLTSIFNSSSTLFTVDVWRRFRRSASDIELMIVGRVFVLVMIVVGVAWIPIVRSGGELFHYIQSVTSYLAPPVCAVYLLAVFWPRCNEQGAFWGLMSGIAVGLIRFIWESVYPKVVCGEEALDTRLSVISRVHYLHMAIILFVITALVAIVVSMVTQPIDPCHLHRLIYWNQNSEAERVELDASDTEEAMGATSRSKGVDNAALHVSMNVVGMGSTPSGSVGGDLPQRTRESSPQVDAGTKFGNNTSRMPPWLRKALFWVCGIETMATDEGQPPNTEPPETAETLNDSVMDSQKAMKFARWKKIADINALILISAALFFLGFFA